MNERVSMGVAIAEAVAKAEGVDATDLEYMLQEYVEVDAIEALIDHPESDWSLSFDVPNYRVTVDSTRAVSVEPRTKSTADDLTAPS